MGRYGRNAPKQDGQFWQSAKANSDYWTRYYNRLVELAVSMFDWKNLPDTVDPRFMELALFTDGMAVFFKDEVMGYLCLRTMIGGNWNVYQIPNERTAYASNGYQNMLTQDNSVIVWNNFLHTNSMLDAQVYANRLWNIDRTIDVNVNAQKTPILIQCEESERLSLKNVYMKYDGNQPVIYADKSLDPKGLSVLQTGAPYIGDQLSDLKNRIWNEALTFLGISNVSYQKKERMITDEMVRSQGGTIASRYSRLEMRRQACNQINEMFGLNIWCDYREDFREIDDELMIENPTDGEGNHVLAVDTRSTTKDYTEGMHNPKTPEAKTLGTGKEGK